MAWRLAGLAGDPVGLDGGLQDLAGGPEGLTGV